jgi:2-dehydropantoate 2-reductase
VSKIAVVGAGAMGGIVGAALAEGGAEVVLVDVSKPLADQVNAHGLTIERGGEQRTSNLPLKLDASEVGVVDSVVFFVKCYHTEAAASLARALVGRSTTVVTLQNGWGNGDVLARFFDPAQIVRGVTYHSGTVTNLGHIRHSNTTDAPTLLGPFEGNDKTRAEAFATAIRAGGLRAEVPSDIGSEIWKKLVLNSSALPTSALTRFTAGALARHQPMMTLVDGLINETVAVGNAKGLDVDLGERLEAVHSTLAGAGDGKASMLQDIEAGRRTEIDVINGAVLRIAEDLDIEVPLNRTMVSLITGYEAAVGLV